MTKMAQNRFNYWKRISITKNQLRGTASKCSKIIKNLQEWTQKLLKQRETVIK